MNWILAFFIFSVSAAPTSTPVVINQVLFYESKQSWTERDHELFEKIKKLALEKSRLSQYTENNDEEFLLSRLATREALVFELTPSKLWLSESQRQSLSGFSAKEIENELKQMALAVALIDMKESQLKQKLRFKTWFDLLKRKYQVKIKSAEFKP